MHFTIIFRPLTLSQDHYSANLSKREHSQKFITATTDKKAPGPPTTFTPFHIYCALEQLSQGSIGRNKLADKLGIGDGAIRTIINRLKAAELISNTKRRLHADSEWTRNMASI